MAIPAPATSRPAPVMGSLGSRRPRLGARRRHRGTARRARQRCGGTARRGAARRCRHGHWLLPMGDNGKSHDCQRRRQHSSSMYHWPPLISGRSAALRAHQPGAPIGHRPSAARLLGSPAQPWAPGGIALLGCGRPSRRRRPIAAQPRSQLRREPPDFAALAEDFAQHPDAW